MLIGIPGPTTSCRFFDLRQWTSMLRLPTVADIAARIRKDRQVLGATAYALDALVVLTFLGLIAIAFPRYVKARDGWREDEVKANLKVIQVALERYGTDHNGEYPLILYGGHPTDTFATTRSPLVSEFPGDVDWLLQHGYLQQYPQNPFRRGNKGPVRLQAKDFFPEEFQAEKDGNGMIVPRVNIWVRGGRGRAENRSQQWAERTIGGPEGDRMWEVTEGQRHPPFLIFDASPASHPVEYGLRSADANPDPKTLRAPPEVSQQVWPAVGNFYYYPSFTGIGNLGSFVSDSSGVDYTKPLKGTVTGYRLAGYGNFTNLGDDCYTWYGDFPDRSLNGIYRQFDQGDYISDACVFGGPDGRPDGVIAVERDLESSKPRGMINQDD